MGDALTSQTESCACNIRRRQAPPPQRRFVFKQTGTGRAHNLHTAKPDSDLRIEQKLFVDCPRQHPEAARAYKDLKRDLAEQFSDSREQHSSAGSAFVAVILEQARGRQSFTL